MEEQRRALDEQRALLQETDYDDLETRFALLTAARTLLGQEIAAERELLDSLVELDEATWAFITLFEENNQLAKNRINALLSKRPPGHYVPDTYRSSANDSSYPANQPIGLPSEVKTWPRRHAAQTTRFHPHAHDPLHGSGLVTTRPRAELLTRRRSLFLQAEKRGLSRGGPERGGFFGFNPDGLRPEETLNCIR